MTVRNFGYQDSDQHLFIVDLLKEELKSRKLFDAFRKAGLNDCPFQPSLDNLILQCLGICGNIDQIFPAYNAILEKRSRKIKSSSQSVETQALKVYKDLILLKAELKDT